MTSPVPCRLSYAEFHAEGRPFVERHHYTHRCPCVQKASYALRNQRGKVCAVAVYGPPPSPAVARALVGPEHAHLVIWQARLIGQGISAIDLDGLQDFARASLATTHGYSYIYTMTESRAHMIDGLAGRTRASLALSAYAGWQYARNGWLYLGATTPATRTGSYVIDGRVHHDRQGKHTLSRGTVRALYPAAQSIRAIRATPKARWVDVLADAPAERALLIARLRYPVQEFLPIIQERLLARLDRGHHLITKQKGWSIFLPSSAPLS